MYEIINNQLINEEEKIMKLLDTKQGNTKVRKSLKYSNWKGINPDNTDFASLSLMPDYKICGGSKSAGCMDLCLKGSGFAKIFNSVNVARQTKTNFLLNDKQGFINQLSKELFNYNKKCIKNNKKGFVRLNTISDYPFYKTGLMEKNNDLEFIDYTKIAKRLFEQLPSNYHLTMSDSKEPKAQRQVDYALKRGANVATVFFVKKGQPLPVMHRGRRVIDGDIDDNRIDDNKNVIVGLRLKGNKAIKNIKQSNFVYTNAI